MDTDPGKHSSSLAELRAYSDLIIFNDMEIATIRSASIFIYDAENVAGSYVLLPNANASSKDHKKARIAPPPHSITFIKLKLGSSTPIISYADAISLADFQLCYNNAPWLRKILEAEGYKTVNDLVSEYTVNDGNVLRYKPAVLYPHKNNITDTVFYNRMNEVISNCDIGGHYSIIRQEKDCYYNVHQYYSGTNQLKMTGHYSSADTEIKQGLFLNYFSTGGLSSKGEYSNNRETGKWQYYYDTLDNPLWYEASYTEGHAQGVLTSYYVNGKVKRKEEHEYNEKAMEERRVKRKSYYVNIPKDTIISGNCFDENGISIKFTPFETQPFAKYNMFEFLVKTLKYPGEAVRNNIEGRVILRFVVQQDGAIADVHVIQGVSPEIDEEAIRVISAMPPWQPGVRDGEQVAAVYTFPLVFKLE